MPDKQRENLDNISANNETDMRGKHPNSMANLKPFPKGVSGNPLGRPSKMEGLKRELNKIGDEVYDLFDNDIVDKTKRETVLHQIWKMAIYGDMRSINLLVELGCLNEKD